jgi:hypothetical protein
VSHAQAHIPRLIDWLHAELRRDLRTAARWSAREWGRAVVDTVLAPGLVLRAMVHACVHAINHAPGSATTRVSVTAAPIAASTWRRRDRLQATLLCWWLLAWSLTPLVSLPTDPTTAAIVVVQAVPLAVDPLLP